MANCDMCGSEGKLFHVLIEGVELTVCKKCSSFGTIVKKPRFKKAKPVEKSGPEIIQLIRADFAKVIRTKREKLGLKQKEFAKFLSEKESIIHKIESGSYALPLALARKMEKQLSISLVEQHEISHSKVKTKKETVTIGDIIKVK